MESSWVPVALCCSNAAYVLMKTEGGGAEAGAVPPVGTGEDWKSRKSTVTGGTAYGLLHRNHPRRADSRCVEGVGRPDSQTSGALAGD